MKPYKNENVFCGSIYAGRNKGQISKHAGTRIHCETKSRLDFTKVSSKVYRLWSTALHATEGLKQAAISLRNPVTLAGLFLILS